jgi:hypothetical protein
MSRKKKVVRDYSEYSAPALHAFGSNVVEDMTASALTFPTPDVPLAVLQAALDDFQVKIVAAIGGGPVKTAEMYEARTNVEGLLHLNGLYVDRIAKGEVAIMLSSGYHISKDPVYGPRPDFWAEMGPRQGEVLLGCKALRQAGAYIWMMNPAEDPADDTNWKNVGYSTQAKGSITDLDSGTRIWFRHCAITRYGLTPPSEPVRVLVP